jgi:putative ABC transport system ATP-binding protein
VGFIFQDYNLINELSVYENIIMPLQLKGTEINGKLINDLLTKLKLIDKKNRYPMQLSGGEQQRVAIIRSLVNNQDIILADEPTGNLDSSNTVMVVELLQYLSKKMGRTILFVTHNMELAKVCDRVIRVKDGKII